MDFKNFKAGNFIKRYEYRSFTPAKINQEWTWSDAQINVMLEKATRKLGQLDAFSLSVPDIDLFIKMHILKEANSSSRIEGTRTEIDEALMNKEDIEPEKRDDWQEVQNYVDSINYAIKRLNDLPLSSRLLKETHKVLLSSARGEHKLPGEFRKSQNWIGGSSPSDAMFVPPTHEELLDLMSDFDNFLHNEEIHVPHLIKVALAHYQFETIHPFLDGNGRIGRLLITLYLVNFKQLNKPSLYLSDFFEKNRPAYYDALSVVRTSNNIIHWIKFFLNAVTSTAEKGILTFQSILELKDKVDSKILTLNKKAPNAKKLIVSLYSKPIVNAMDVSKVLDITSKSAYNIIKDFEDLKILEETTGYQRNRVFVFTDYIKLFLK